MEKNLQRNETCLTPTLPDAAEARSPSWRRDMEGAAVPWWDFCPIQGAPCMEYLPTKPDRLWGKFVGKYSSTMENVGMV